jgi:hypothetical protein
MWKVKKVDMFSRVRNIIRTFPLMAECVGFQFEDVGGVSSKMYEKAHHD